MAVPATRLARHARARRKLTVVRMTRRRARRVPFALFAVVVTSALVLGVTGAQALVAQGSFRIEELTRTAERLERQYGELRLAAAQRGTLERVAEWARREGFVVPDPDQVRVVVLPSPRRVHADPDPAAPPALAVGAGAG